MRFHYSSTFLTFWHLKARFQIRAFVKVISLRTNLFTKVSTSHVENIAMDLVNSLCECIRRSPLDILFREFIEVATWVNHFTMKVVDVLSHQHALEFVRVRLCKLLKIMHSFMPLIRLCRTH